MSVMFSLASLANATTVFKAKSLFTSGSPYKAVNWLILGMFTQLIGACVLGEASVGFLACAYVGYLFYLHKAWDPSLALKGAEKTEAVSATARPTTSVSERIWFMPGVCLAIAGALFSVLPVHILSVAAPWLSVSALVVAKFMMVARVLAPIQYLIVSIPAVAPMIGPVFAAYVPGLLFLEGYFLFLAWSAMKANEDRIALNEPKTPDEDSEAREAIPEPQTKTQSYRSNTPLYELTSRDDRVHKSEPVAPHRPEPTPRDPEPKPVTTQEPEPAAIPPASAHLKKRDITDFSEPAEDSLHDDFFPKPGEVPTTFELPQPILIRLGHVVKSLFTGEQKKPAIRREPTINE